VSVVAATYQRAHLLPRLLAALESQDLDRDRFEVVLIDNGSTDGTCELLAEAERVSPLSLRVLRIASNRGPVPARNAGWRATTAAVVAFTDDDCEPSPRWLSAGLAALRDRPRVGILQGATEPAEPIRRTFAATRSVPAFSGLFEGCNLFVRREALEAGGGFDERIEFFGEDTAMGWAIVEAGWEAGFEPAALVRHAVTYPPFRSYLRERWLEQNLVTVARLHPRFRQEACWRPWCYRRENLTFLVAAAGAAAAILTRRPLALAAATPWLWDRVPRERPSRALLAHVAKRTAVDAVVAAAMARGSLRERTVLL
jgi:GT2 family glycosyltransferase